MDIYVKLPDVLAKLILEYDDRFVWRNGKYMARLNIYSSMYKPINDMLDDKLELLETLGYMRNMIPMYGIVVLNDKPRLDFRNYRLIYCVMNVLALYCYIPWTPNFYI